MNALIFAAGAAEEAQFWPLDMGLAPSLLFWGFLACLAYFFWLAPKMANRSEDLISDREGAVKGDLSDAETANAKAADLLAQYEAKLEEARSEASAAIRGELAEAEKKAIAAETRLSKKIIQQTADSDARIRTALSSVADDLTDSAATTAQAAVARLANLKVTKTVAKSAVKANAS